ncbi:MAG TPA: 50S ribosomal protein L4 [Candidatus Babeliales bacterium]|nr:50S ribosomal protein L4 [Candidatus Babeliales bacterium]
MTVATYTKTGSKSTTPAKLDKAVFGLEVKNHNLLKQAYISYLSDGRTNNAQTKKRGQVRGGGRKPWRQKGTGNARFGSSRNPIWRGGGIAFGPTGGENYSKKLSTSTKRQALRQALSIASKEDRIIIIDLLAVTDGKTRSVISLLKKMGTTGNTCLVADKIDETVKKAVQNIPNVNLTSAKYLNVYKVMSSDKLIFEKAALDSVSQWLGGKK